MLIIATDEAGYGPKLGPLVVAETIGRLPEDRTFSCDRKGGATEDPFEDQQLEEVFHPFYQPVQIGDRSIHIDDSKAVYKPGGGLASLHHVISACQHWCADGAKSVHDFLQRTTTPDLLEIQKTAWLCDIDDSLLTSAEQTSAAVTQWRSNGFELLGVHAQVVTASQFNRICDQGKNKADLLTHATLALIRDALDHYRDTKVRVYCDRHGGRRYYGPAISHWFSEFELEVLSEESKQSRYCLRLDDREVTIAFTVKGDRFAPVALASMHAKYIRERMMESLNTFFANHFSGEAKPRPTAGYPGDASRFLSEMASVLREKGIQQADLVRQR